MWSDTEPLYTVASASPAQTWRTRDQRYQLTGTHCDRCSEFHFPARRVCPRCRSRTLQRSVLPKAGRIVTLTDDRTPVSGQTSRSVRPFGIIELDDCRVAVLAELVDCSPAEVAVGDRVRMVIRRWRRENNGLYQYGYKFRPEGSDR